MGQITAHTAHDLVQMQSLPLEAKSRMTKERIKVWFGSWVRFEIVNLETGKTRFETFDMRDRYEPPLKENECVEREFPGSVYVSFSGGKDSTVLADLCAQVCEMYGYDLYLLFVNTGLEYPEIQKFVKIYADWLRNKYKIEVHLEIVRPEMRFDEVLRKYGYPIIGKKQANVIDLARKNLEQRKYSLRLRLLGVTAEEAEQMNLEMPSEEMLARYEKSVIGSMNYIPNYRYLLNANFHPSDKCCDVMKKKPAHHYAEATGRMPIIATMADESMIRRNAWLKNGCNAFDAKFPKSQPMSFWTQQDILHYVKKNDIPICSVYGEIVSDQDSEFDGQMNLIDYLGCYEPEDTLKTTGCDRTGCIFCMFGCHLEKEPNRFQRLKETHPRQYEYCIGGGEMVDGKWQPNKQGLGLGHVLDYIGVPYK